ncbi:MAG: DUF4412 domain-containing protein [Flavobacteriia bacterium]|nr:DUF4412 domain-containing protein [Flavobacteriia bacterium]
MKALIFLCLIPIGGLKFVYAQHSQGIVEYAITVKPADTTALQKQRAALLFDSKMALQFNDSLARMDFKMGKGMLTTIIVNNALKEGISLNSTSAGKFAYYLNKEYFNQNTKVDENVVVKIINEEKRVLGYLCRRADLISGSTTTTYWYTNEVSFDIKQQSLVNKNIPGFPLKYNTISDGLYMEFEATNIDFELKNVDEIFSLKIPEGFKVVK